MVSWGTQTLGKRPGGIKPQRFILEMIHVIEKVRLPIMAPLLHMYVFNSGPYLYLKT